MCRVISAVKGKASAAYNIKRGGGWLWLKELCRTLK